VRSKLLRECSRPGFAAVARYLKPIGKGVEGPSIRFAETAIRLMGNISVDQMTVYDDREKRIVRVTVVDCETNTPYSSDVTIEKSVERSFVRDGDEVIRARTNSRGKMVYLIPATEDDLLNKQNALVSKAIRSNGLRLVPGDIIDEAMEQVAATQRDQNAQDPDRSKRKLFDAFTQIGITVTQVKAYLGHDAETLTEKELLDLRAIYSGIRDGDTTWQEAMQSKAKPEPEAHEAPTAQSATEAVKAHLGKSKSQEKRVAAQTTGQTFVPPKEQVQEPMFPREPGDDVA
jgi:hypothetical protein